MRAHIVIISFSGLTQQIPKFLGGRAAVLLRDEYPESEGNTRHWIDSGAWSVTGSSFGTFELNTPNKVTPQQVITAFNRAVRSLLPEISNTQWETRLFASIPCANQDR